MKIRPDRSVALTVRLVVGAALAAGGCGGGAAAAAPAAARLTAEGARVESARTLSLAGARRASDAALAEIARRGVTGTVAVADRAGFLVSLRRAPGTFVGGDEVSIGKAFTAAVFRKATRLFEETIRDGRPAMLRIPRWTPLTGGVPITLDGEVVGAVGVSGASSADEDEAIALVAARAVEAAADGDGGGVDPIGRPAAPGGAGGARLPAAASTAPAGTLTLAGAEVALAAVVAEARRRGTRGAVAVADATGHLVAFERIDGTFPAGAEVAAGKARTASLFRRPTRAFEEIIGGGRLAMLAVEFTPLVGGVPIELGGEVVGAVAVAGASSADEDEALARVGVDALVAAEVAR